MHVPCEENLNLFGLKYECDVVNRAARQFLSVNVNDLGIIVTQLLRQKGEIAAQRIMSVNILLTVETKSLINVYDK